MERRYGAALWFVNPGLSFGVPPLVVVLALLLCAPAVVLAGSGQVAGDDVTVPGHAWAVLGAPS